VPVAAASETVAVNVMLAPTAGEVVDAASAVVVAVRLDEEVIVSVSASDVLAASVVDPP
jgi:hypothetical protein